MDSPFTHRLHTNFVPSDGQCNDIRAFLVSPQDQLAHLDKEVARLQRLLEETIHKRDQLKVLVDAHLALVSPVRRLPDDILRAIFCETLPSSRDSALIPKEGPLLLSQICKLWRSVALTSPRIWASMYIVIPSNNRMDRLLDLVKTWLRRSGNVPLSISMALSRVWTRHDDISALLSLLMSAASRWKDVEICLPQRSNRSLLSGLRTEDVPLLESLKLFAHGDRSPPTVNVHGVDEPSLAFLGAPSLTSLYFRGSQALLPYPESWANWKCLTLILRGPDSFRLVILQECRALQRLDIVFSRVPLQYLDSSHHIPLPQLTHLSITSYGDDINQRLSECFSLPALQSLELHSPSADLIWLQHFAHTLKRLKVAVSSMVSDTVVEALASLPYLEELLMDGEPLLSGDLGPNQPGAYDPNFLARLMSSPNSAPILPLLQRIEICSLVWTPEETVLNFVQARASAAAETNHVTSLCHASFQFNRQKDVNLEHELRDAIAGGLSLSVSYGQGFSLTYSPLEGLEGFEPSPMVLPPVYYWNEGWH